MVLPPFLPSSAWAAEDFRGFFLPSLAAFAFAFLAVSLPLPFLSATVGLLPVVHPYPAGRAGTVGLRSGRARRGPGRPQRVPVAVLRRVAAGEQAEDAQVAAGDGAGDEQRQPAGGERAVVGRGGPLAGEPTALGDDRVRAVEAGQDVAGEREGPAPAPDPGRGGPP